MPILGKRKYINEQIEKILNTLEEKGYDVTYIKNKWYDIIPSTQTEDEFENSYEGLSSGAILPYRKKVNEVLKMIEDLLQPEAPKDINNYSNISEISPMPSMPTIPTLPNNSSDIKDILRNAILSNRSEQNENQPINQYDFMN